jgi:GABA(A) receptor-associated protein
MWLFLSSEQRKKESRQILQKYPDRIPVVVQRAPKSNLVDLDKHKFLVPFEVTIAQFMWILRQRLTLSPNKAIYLFVNRTLPQAW